MVSPGAQLDIAALRHSCATCSLVELCLPRGLDKAELEAMGNVVHRRPPVDRGEYLFRTGDPFRSLYAVKTGSLKTFVTTETGDEQIIGFQMPGELAGLDGLGADCHMSYAVALETTYVCELPYEKLGELCRKYPSLQHEIYSLMSREIRDDQAMLLMMARRSAEDRLISFLISMSERFHRRGFSASEFNLSMSRHDIANYLGLAPETVSRLFGRFQEDGLIDVQRRRLRIRDLKGLRASLGSGSIA